MTNRESIVEVLNRLYYYTDYQDWEYLKAEVFAEKVMLDMTSLGAPEPQLRTAQSICDEWQEGFKDLDAIHHQTGNYIIDILGEQAKAKTYGIAIHYKEDAIEGTTREFVGSYDIELNHFSVGWRITALKFNLKYMRGNLELK
ncbi:MAG: nuclear transport factor 2 family protein [Bacteroidota bacterium]